MKKAFKTNASLLPILLTALLGNASAQAGFVSDFGNELYAPADLDGDGRTDLVVVDKASGTFRAGYQLSADVFTWAESRALGGTNISGLAVGPVITTGHDSLAVASPMHNRITVLSPTTPTGHPVLVPVFGNSFGPNTPVAIEVGGGTPETDLMVASTLSTPTDHRVELIESAGTSFSPLANWGIPGAWERGNNIDFFAGNRAAAFIDRATNTLRLYDVSSGTIVHLDSIVLSGLADPDYCVIHPIPGGYAHFLAWDRGTPNVLLIELRSGTAFATPMPIDLKGSVDHIQTVSDGTDERLLVTLSDGTALVFTYDGSTPPALDQEIGVPDTGNRFTAALPSGPGRFILVQAPLSGGPGSSAELYAFDGTQFVLSDHMDLPPVRPTRARGNVMTFRDEPFVTPSPGKLQVLNAGDWSDQASLRGSPARVAAKYEIDRGPSSGLGSNAASDLGPAHVDAQFALVNQAGTTFSVFNFEPAIGEQGAEVLVSPAPGRYSTGVSVSFTNTTGGTIYYRDASASAWSVFASPLPLYQDTTLLYFGTAGSARSPIKTASYRFDISPSDLDSDGDGVPDYVEIDQNLDPVLSGADADGDGLLDLEELIGGTDPNLADSDGDGVSDLNERKAGTDPNNPADTPALPITGTASRIGQDAGFNLLITPRPYDGTTNAVTLCQTGTPLRAYSGGGWLHAYATAASNTTAGVTDPSVKLPDIPQTIAPQFVTVLTDQHFDIATAYSNSAIGIEMAGIYLPPAPATIHVGYQYSGGSTATEAANWIAAAQAAYATNPPPTVTGELTTDRVLATLLTERKLVDELYVRGVYTNRQVSILAGRPGDAALQTATEQELLSLQTETNSQPAFLPETVITAINTGITSSNLTELVQLTRELYDVCSERSDQLPGAYPLPIGVLRDFLLSGTLQSNYTAVITLNSNDLARAYASANTLLSSISSRPSSTFTLEVRNGSLTNACPVLYTAAGAAKSLYDHNGHPYVLPFSFELGTGAVLSATAFTDVSWNRCPGTDPIEVISLSLTAVPTASDADTDGNLLPDAFEQHLLGGGGNPAFIDSDGDSYSDLQEYLEGTDPSDALSQPGVPVADLHPPVITITPQNSTQVQLDIGWPATYADPFIFSVVHTTNLVANGFAPVDELPQGALSRQMDASAADAAFYRVQMRLR